MGIQIRQALPIDAVGACEVLRRSITECCIQDHQHQPHILDAWLGNKTAHNVAAWFASPSHFAIVAERDGILVGVALLTQAGKLSLCYLVPEALHAGIGKAMLEAVEAQARRWGIGVLKLHSTASAHGFYVRNGYILAGQERSCYGVDCGFFWKQLNVTASTAAAEGGPAKRFCNCSTQ